MVTITETTENSEVGTEEFNNMLAGMLGVDYSILDDKEEEKQGRLEIMAKDNSVIDNDPLNPENEDDKSYFIALKLAKEAGLNMKTITELYNNRKKLQWLPKHLKEIGVFDSGPNYIYNKKNLESLIEKLKKYLREKQKLEKTKNEKPLILKIPVEYYTKGIWPSYEKPQAFVLIEYHKDTYEQVPLGIGFEYQQFGGLIKIHLKNGNFFSVKYNNDGLSYYSKENYRDLIGTLILSRLSIAKNKMKRRLAYNK